MLPLLLNTKTTRTACCVPALGTSSGVFFIAFFCLNYCKGPICCQGHSLTKYWSHDDQGEKVYRWNKASSEPFCHIKGLLFKVLQLESSLHYRGRKKGIAWNVLHLCPYWIFSMLIEFSPEILDRCKIQGLFALQMMLNIKVLQSPDAPLYQSWCCHLYWWGYLRNVPNRRF